MFRQGKTARDAYRDAWQVRERTGQTDESLLLQALRARRAPTDLLDAGPVHDTLLSLWREGVPPGRAGRSAARGWVTTLASRAARTARSAGRDDGWTELPAGRRLSDAARRRLRRPVDLTPLPFRRLAEGREALARGAGLPVGGRPPWSELRVWLRAVPAPEAAVTVMAGAVPVGETALHDQVVTALRREADRGVFADGWLEVTGGGTVPEVTVGALHCHLPRA